MERVKDAVSPKAVDDSREQINKDKTRQRQDKREYQEAVNDTQNRCNVRVKCIPTPPGQHQYQTYDHEGEDNAADGGKRAFDIPPA